MWNYTEDQWRSEVLSSLKKTEFPQFLKQIISNEFISPFSFGSVAEPFERVDSSKKFYCIQNFEELHRHGMQEWIQHEDVGFRFRQLSDIALDKIPPQKPLFLSQPFPFLPSDEQHKKLTQINEQEHRLHLGWSPLSFGLTRGEILKKPFAHWEKIFSSSILENPSLVWFYLSSAPYQWAGAEPHVELGVLLSIAHSTISELQSFGIDFEKSANRFSFGLSLGTDLLVESSKVSAFKILWQRYGELQSANSQNVYGCELYALPSLRSFSGRDVLNNLLRTTLMSLAAAIGGAHGFKCIPYDALNKNKSSDAIRISTNIPLLLKQEGLVTQVQNILDGSPLFTNSVNKICEKAWMFFQEIEKKGGVFEAVRSGWLQMELKRQEEFSKNQLSYLQKELVGVNKFVSRHVENSPTEPGALLRLSDIIDPLFLTKSPDDYLTVEPLLVHSLCYEWDAVQVNSDRYFKKTGKYPSIPVIRGGGPIVEKKVNWLKQLFLIAGFDMEVISADDSSLEDPSSPLLILVPSQDEMEETLVAQYQKMIRGRIWSMGDSKSHSKIDKFLQTDVNVLEVVKEMQAIVLEGR